MGWFEETPLAEQLRVAARNVEMARMRGQVQHLAGWEHRVMREAAQGIDARSGATACGRDRDDDGDRATHEPSQSPLSRPSVGIPSAGKAAKFAWQQIAMGVDWNRCDIYRAADFPQLEISMNPPEVALSYWEFRRHNVYERETGKPAGRAVFARHSTGGDWLPLDPIPPQYVVA